MKTVTHDIENLARRFFNVELPVVATVLKSAFRRAAKELHTDTGGDKESFVQMKAVYDRIQEMGLVVQPDADVPSGAWKILRTVDGTPLTDLGLGLGPTVNGRDCEQCEAKGYRQHFDVETQRCNACAGQGSVVPCRACHATGSFTQRSGRVVACYRCAGNGYIPSTDLWSYRTPAQACTKCLGTGRVGKSKQQKYYVRCGACEGKGEIKIYNPVILKGAMSQAQRKRQK